MLPAGMKIDETRIKESVDQIPDKPWWIKNPFVTPDSLYKKLLAVDKRILELSQRKFQVDSVLLTFEKQQTHRQFLERLNVGYWSILQQRKQSVQYDHLFRGRYVLEAIRPAEPSSIHWEDLNEDMFVS